jgi:hypothetical protein
MKLLKDSLAKLKTDIEVIFRIQRTTGNLFLNKGEHKFSLVGMNALVFSTDSLVLKELFGYGKKSRIDTTSSSVKRFNHEFLPVFNEPDSKQGYLFLIRTRTNGRGFACNPEEDKEIAALLKLIYKKNVEVQWVKHDKYQRVLGRIILNNTDICLEQIKYGMAWHYKKYKNEQSLEDRYTYSKAEEVARNSRIGLWSDIAPIEPSKFRHK